MRARYRTARRLLKRDRAPIVIVQKPRRPDLEVHRVMPGWGWPVLSHRCMEGCGMFLPGLACDVSHAPAVGRPPACDDAPAKGTREPLRHQVQPHFPRPPKNYESVKVLLCYMKDYQMPAGQWYLSILQSELQVSCAILSLLHLQRDTTIVHLSYVHHFPSSCFCYLFG
jgi:hypothetical protein